MLKINSYHTLIFDFDGVFTDNKVYLDENGKETVRCCRGDGFGFDLLRKYQQKKGLNLDVFILSKEKNPVVLRRAEKLKIQCLHGVDDKLVNLTAYFAKNRPNDPHPFEGLIFVGNDLNDLSVMKRAKLSFAPADSHSIIQSVATVVTQEQGGNGCVRAIIERLLGIDNMPLEEIEDFLS